MASLRFKSIRVPVKSEWASGIAMSDENYGDPLSLSLYFSFFLPGCDCCDCERISLIQYLYLLSYYYLFWRICFVCLFHLLLLQNEFNVGLDLSEARASLLSGDVVELTNATSTDSTSMKLVWEVSKRQNHFFPISAEKQQEKQIQRIWNFWRIKKKEQIPFAVSFFDKFHAA